MFGENARFFEEMTPDDKDRTMFLLTSVADSFGDKEMLEYTGKLIEAGFDVYTEKPDDTKRYRDHYIYVNSIGDLMKLIDTVGYEVVISRSYKGDPPCLEIYDDYRE